MIGNGRQQFLQDMMQTAPQIFEAVLEQAGGGKRLRAVAKSLPFRHGGEAILPHAASPFVFPSPFPLALPFFPEEPLALPFALLPLPARFFSFRSLHHG